MKSVTKLGKLRGRSAKELRVRGSQMLQAFAERRGWSSQGRIPSDATFFALIDSSLLRSTEILDTALLDHFRTRTTPRFFPSFHDTDETVAALLERFGSDAVIERARSISAGRFDLLGLKELDFGSPINWHLEPISRVVAPSKHWSQIAYLDAAQAGDKKVTWELNRHAYFSTLGRAYWRTKDELFARTFAAQIDSWMEANPPKVGINWASSLEVAFRSISWLWSLHFFKDTAHLEPKLFLRILKLLYLHGRHLETYLSTYFSPNTHLTGEALGLFYLGTLLPELRCSGRWRQLGQEILIEQLEYHLRADGVYFEQSSYYHRYTADFYTHLFLLLRENGLPIPSTLEVGLKALFDHLMYITRPDGSTALVGDDDGGRLVMLDNSAPDDFRSTLSNGAALFNRADYKYVAKDVSEETLWLLGAKGLETLDHLEEKVPAHESYAFTEGGYYVMRDGWSENANYLLLDCGPLGSLNYAHAHADMLSFDLAAHGRTLLVDPGTYTYTGSAELRDYFRSSAAHNTLTIDGESSSVSDGPFSWKQVAEAQALSWISRPRFDFFKGEHNGYERLASPAKHTRSVLFLKGDYWVIHDRVETSGTHQYELNFHFAAGANPKVEGGEGEVMVRERPGDAPGLELMVSGESGKWSVKEGWVSNSYGARTAAPMCTFELQATGAQEFVTFLFPRRAHDERIRVREIAAKGGRAFDIGDETTHDLFLVGVNQIEASEIVSNFQFSWLRLNAATTGLEELVLLNGHQLSLNGQEIVDSSEFIKYLSAKRAGQGLRGETDALSTWHCAIHDSSPQLLKQ